MLPSYPEIAAYHEGLNENDQVLCRVLFEEICSGLPNASAKIWHGHPVWFLEGNPIVGYSRLKSGIRLLFWSGQSFDEPALQKEGKFKAAEMRYSSVEEVDRGALQCWLGKSIEIQWDYKNIVKRKGVLERLISK
ncbi:MAG: DUF1801 domain-containing protein [Rhodothermia bacterium]|nr:DUF1801 domain-containing protein [Rhodothermia bacterium]